MKSIIEEGSSVAKAVDQAWNRAGKPMEFTIKVFQQAEKNFLGFTKVPAKIGIFFAAPAQEKAAAVKSGTQQRQKPVAQVTPAEWTPEVLKIAEKWIKDVLVIMDLPDIEVTLKPDRQILRVLFSKSIIQNEGIDARRFFSNLAYLMLAAIRSSSKLELKNYQILMRSNS